MGRVTWRGLRDAGIFALGSWALIHEIVAVPEPRWQIILVATAALGIPATLTADRRFVQSDPTSTPPPPAAEQSGPGPR